MTTRFGGVYKLMYDRPTNSLWNQLTGEPVSGRLAESGIQLERLPIVVTTWGEWKKEHPGTVVLDPRKTATTKRARTSPTSNRRKRCFPCGSRAIA
jgi:hypothetical protein